MALNTNGRKPSSKPIFPGVEDNQQLCMILKVLGSQTKKPEFQQLPTKCKQELLKYGSNFAGSGLRNKVPADVVGEHAVHLMESMLHFFPQRRLTMQDAPE